MEGSKIGFQKWMIAAFLLTTSLKSVSSMKLHRDLGVTQKTAWFMAQRLRAAFEAGGPTVRFEGPVEVDETFVGGKRKNMHAKKRKKLEGRGTVGKTAVVGIKDRETKQAGFPGQSGAASRAVCSPPAHQLSQTARDSRGRGLSQHKRGTTGFREPEITAQVLPIAYPGPERRSTPHS